MPRRHDETMEAFCIRQIKNEIYAECITLIEANAPPHEAGDYWAGRRDAADKIRDLIDNG